VECLSTVDLKVEAFARVVAHLSQEVAWLLHSLVDLTRVVGVMNLVLNEEVVLTLVVLKVEVY